MCVCLRGADLPPDDSKANVCMFVEGGNFIPDPVSSSKICAN